MYYTPLYNELKSILSEVLMNKYQWIIINIFSMYKVHIKNDT